VTSPGLTSPHVHQTAVACGRRLRRSLQRGSLRHERDTSVSTDNVRLQKQLHEYRGDTSRGVTPLRLSPSPSAPASQSCTAVPTHRHSITQTLHPDPEPPSRNRGGAGPDRSSPQDHNREPQTGAREHLNASGQETHPDHYSWGVDLQATHPTPPRFLRVAAAEHIHHRKEGFAPETQGETDLKNHKQAQGTT